MEKDRYTNTKCFLCNSTETYYSKSHGYHRWYKLENNELICSKCYYKEYHYRVKQGEFLSYKQKIGLRICSNCKSSKTQTTITKKGYPHRKWVSDGKNGYLCHKCARKIIYRKRELEHNKRKLVYKRKNITLPYNPRIGVCSWCRAVAPIDTPRTHLHHEKYDDNNPLANTIELCMKCHNTLTRQQQIETSKSQINS